MPAEFILSSGAFEFEDYVKALDLHDPNSGFSDWKRKLRLKTRNFEDLDGIHSLIGTLQTRTDRITEAVKEFTGGYEPNSLDQIYQEVTWLFEKLGKSDSGILKFLACGYGVN